MKKPKQNKNASKETKLPLIQSNLQKGSLKQDSNSKEKLTQKSKQINIPQIPNIPLTNKNIPESTNKSKSEKRRKKYNYIVKEEENVEPEKTKEEVPRITEEKLAQLKMQRKKRLEKEKKEEEKEIKLYTELIEEYKNSNKKKQKDYNSKILENANKSVNISGAKAQKILEDGGMLDAYKYVLSQLCKQGLPTGNIFEYASIVVKNYEKKWKEKKSKMAKEKIEKYYEEKQKEIQNENKNEIKVVNKSLEHRDELKFIQSLDKSRSRINIKERNFKENIEKKDTNIISNDTRSYNIKNNIKKLNTKVNNSNDFNKNKSISQTNGIINNNKKESNSNKIEIKKRKK
jgi:hypothetical protein